MSGANPLSFNGDFLLRILHLDALLDGGFDLVLSADQEYLYFCDWPLSKSHSQNLRRFIRYFGMTIEELLNLGVPNFHPEDQSSPTPYIIGEGLLQSSYLRVTPTYTPGENPILDMTVEQLKQYIIGSRREFDLPVRPIGSEFQIRVWERLKEIPYGQTITYGQIAKDLGITGGYQAVGNAVGANPVSIIIPCHRVLSHAGLGGYAAGLGIKKALLALEGRSSSLFGISDQ